MNAVYRDIQLQNPYQLVTCWIYLRRFRMVPLQKSWFKSQQNIILLSWQGCLKSTSPKNVTIHIFVLIKTGWLQSIVNFILSYTPVYPQEKTTPYLKYWIGNAGSSSVMITILLRMFVQPVCLAQIFCLCRTSQCVHPQPGPVLGLLTLNSGIIVNQTQLHCEKNLTV